jgi:vitamin K-dependent gamma-carboxylase
MSGLAKPQIPARESREPRHITLAEQAWQPIDPASLAVFRIALGAIMLGEVWRYLQPRDAGRLAWVEELFLRPHFRFTYHGLEWLSLWPQSGLYMHFGVLGLLAFLVMVGLWYRVAIGLFWLAFTYVALLDKSQYLNHFYLVSLLAFLMIFVPANRAWSLDAWFWPQIARPTVPAWMLWMLRFQVAIPYIYGGLAKLNGDWLHGQPMQLWMSRMEGVRGWTPAFGEHWLALVFSYGGLALDLGVVPLLLWRRTRVFAFCWVVAFHVMNAVMFQIGIFPWLMIAATTLFFEPDWPRRVVAWLRPEGRGSGIGKTRRAERSAAGPARQEPRPPEPDLRSSGWQYIVIALLGLYVAVQVLVPFRHLLYPGNVDWTEEGTLFSWRMMLNEKPAALQFLAIDRVSGKRQPVHPRPFLSPHQIERMSRDPEMIREFAAFLKEAFRVTGKGDVEIHVVALCSLNGRKPQLLVDPAIDLGAQPRRWGPQPYIVPLTEPRRDEPWNVPQLEWPRHVEIPPID